MKELTPAQRALNKYRSAVADMVAAKQRQTTAKIAYDRASEDLYLAVDKATDAEDAADRARGELEDLIAPQEPA